MVRYFNEIDFFGHLFTPQPIRKTVATTERADHYEIKIVAPGLKKSDFNITFKEDCVSVKFEQAVESTAFLNKESFYESWQVPKGTQPEDIVARYEAGILSLLVKKSEQIKPKTHLIDVQ